MTILADPPSSKNDRKRITYIARGLMRFGERCASLRLLHPRPLDGIEEHLEGSFGLSAVLYPKAEEHDSSFAVGHRNGGCFARQFFRAANPARKQDVLVVLRVARQDPALDFHSR